MAGSFDLLVVAALTATITAAAEPEPAPPRQRAISPRLSAVITAPLPKYESAADGRTSRGAGRLAPEDRPKNNIVRLPDYIVREPRLPDDAEVLADQGRGIIAMRQYLGDSDGLFRGYLNAFTLGELWQKIPALGRIPFVPFGSVANQELALEVYDRVERKRRLQELMGLEALARQAENPAAPAPSSKTP